MTADWLVNYNYGFVKIGLSGTIFLSITRYKDTFIRFVIFFFNL